VSETPQAVKLALKELGYYATAAKIAGLMPSQAQPMIDEFKAEAKRKFREMAKTMHPDHGGTTEEFQAYASAMDIIENWRARASTAVFDSAFGWVKSR